MEVMSLKSFIGGIHPKDQKQYTKDLPIIKIKASDEVVFPLKQHIGAPCQPIVKVKDEIKVGQVIACSDAFVSSPINKLLLLMMDYIKKLKIIIINKN